MREPHGRGCRLGRCGWPALNMAPGPPGCPEGGGSGLGVKGAPASRRLRRLRCAPPLTPSPPPQRRTSTGRPRGGTLDHSRRDRGLRCRVRTGSPCVAVTGWGRVRPGNGSRLRQASADRSIVGGRHEQGARAASAMGPGLVGRLTVVGGWVGACPARTLSPRPGKAGISGVVEGGCRRVPSISAHPWRVAGTFLQAARLGAP